MISALAAANGHLSEMIRLINASLADLQKADKSKLDQTNKALNAEMEGFVSAKKSLDAKLLELAQAHPDAALDELIGDEGNEQLKIMRLNLAALREKNQQYAGLIMSLRDFYSELCAKMFNLDETYSEYFSNKIY